MGNEASAEGGDGDLPGLPGGSGGSDDIPAGAEAIAEDGRRTAAARSCPPHRHVASSPSGRAGAHTLTLWHPYTSPYLPDTGARAGDRC